MKVGFSSSCWGTGLYSKTCLWASSLCKQIFCDFIENSRRTFFAFLWFLGVYCIDRIELFRWYLIIGVCCDWWDFITGAVDNLEYAYIILDWDFGGSSPNKVFGIFQIRRFVLSCILKKIFPGYFHFHFWVDPFPKVLGDYLFGS